MERTVENRVVKCSRTELQVPWEASPTSEPRGLVSLTAFPRTGNNVVGPQKLGGEK